MNAELFLLGHRIDMAPRHRRRWLVALVYALFFAGMTGGWFLDRWGLSAVWLVMVTSLIVPLLLGGKYPGALVKPFAGKRTAFNSQAPALLFLRWGFRGVRESSDGEYRSDEREQRQSDRAHSRAYRAMYAVLLLLWGVAFNLVARHPFLPAVTAGQLTYGMAVLSLFLTFTLPQAILLWTEPDMEREQ
jgi:hypothetical protein